MAEAPAWGVVVLPGVLGLLALVAAGMDAAFGARAQGRGLSLDVIAQPVREALRLLATQRRSLLAADRALWRLGVAIVVLAPLLAGVVVPLGARPLADLSVGIAWWGALLALLWAALYMCGWGPNSALSLVGGYRFLAQALAYEMPLQITIIGVGLAAGSLRASTVVGAQAGHLWYVVVMPVGLVVYLVSGMAAAFWGPFSAPLGADLAGGAVLECSGVDRLVVLLGRYLALVVVAGFGAALFLGGGAGPLLPGWAWTVVKTLSLLAVMVGARWSVPVLRPDRFEEMAWMVLLPASIVQLFAVGALVLADPALIR